MVGDMPLWRNSLWKKVEGVEQEFLKADSRISFEPSVF
jgi:hypothetical protein